jgi:MFS family permease
VEDPQLRALLVMAAIWGFFAWSYFPLLPVFGVKTLGLTERGVAGLISCFGLGAVLGSLAVARDVTGRDRFPRIVMAFGGFGVGLGLLGGLPHQVVAFPAMFIMGAFQATGLSLMGGTIQRKIAPGLRGRANAIYLTAIIGITPFGTLLAGETAQLLGAQGPRLVILADGLILLASALGLAFILRKSQPLPEPAA